MEITPCSTVNLSLIHISFGRALKLRQTKDSILLFCSEEEFEAVWRGYFDLDADYEEKRRRLSAISPILAEASSYAPGIRILRQDSWEALCSFLISQHNNIPRIKAVSYTHLEAAV